MRILENLRQNWFARVIRTRAKRVVALVLVIVMASAMVFAVTGGNTGEGFDFARNQADEGYVGADFPVQDVAVAGNRVGEFGTLGHAGDGHGHGKDMYFAMTITRGQSIESILPEEPELWGYSFTHWSLMPDGAPFNFSRPLYDDTAFYAIWRFDDSTTYDASYGCEGDYISEAPYYLYDDVYCDEGADYSYYWYAYGYSYGAQDYYYPIYGYEPSYDHVYDYTYDYYYNYEYANDYEAAYDGYVYITQAPSYLYSGYVYDYGPIYDHGYVFDYTYDYYDYGYVYSNDYRYAYNYHNSYDYRYADYNNHEYGYEYYHNNGYDYIYGYYYNYDYDFYYDYGYAYESSQQVDFLYGEVYTGGDTIIIRFLLNHGGMWLDSPLAAFNDAPFMGINIDIDERGNIDIVPNIAHGIILDGDYIYIRIPVEIDFSDISVDLPQDWIYEAIHEEVELGGIGIGVGEDGEDIPFEIELITHTVIIVNHTWNDEPQDGFVGIMPLAFNLPGGFAPHTVASTFTLGDWNDAIGTTGDRVVIVPSDATIPGQINISGARHVIIVSEDTNLQGTVDNHLAPPGGAFTVTHLGAGRHFTIANNTTLTLSHIVLDGGFAVPDASSSRGGIIINSGGNLHLLSGSIIRNSLLNDWTHGAGVRADGTLGAFTMSGNASITNNTANNGQGGGVAIAGGRTFTMSGTSSITNNFAARYGGGVALAGWANFTMSGGSITGNTAHDTPGWNTVGNGGGVALHANGAQFTMSGGIISGNIAMGRPVANIVGNGGGVWIVAGASSLFTMTGGTISNNEATGDGGGIFTAAFTYQSPLPAGLHFPQLNISALAIFTGNIAGNGSFAPPTNAGLPSTNIAQTAQRSGGFGHPLNNLDINFMFGDWLTLNAAVNNTAVNNIVIHPAGTLGVTPGLTGSTYNLIIFPGNGSTITTMSIAGAPTADPHRINVANRTVTIEAAPGADIELVMTEITPINIGRHFIVGANGHLTLGGGPLSGTLTVNGSANMLAGNRGGVMVDVGTGSLTLTQGGAISNNRAANGGGVMLNANGAIFNMSGGNISNNLAEGNGGGLWIGAGANSLFAMTSGTISNNTANGDGGGIFTSMFTYTNFFTGTGHFPQLDISQPAIFTENFAGNGGFVPSEDVHLYTNIEITAQRSGGFDHPLNNFDINFNVAGDWFLINDIVANLPSADYIIIHPTGATSVTPGITGNIFNLVISDPGNGSTITSTHVSGPNPHSINVLRPVTIKAAPDTNIVLDMTFGNLTPGASSPNFDIGRHFFVGMNGDLTLGSSGSGHLTLRTNADIITTGIRGGITVNGVDAVLTMAEGSTIANSRAVTGGGVMLGNTGATLNMEGGSIINNRGTTNGGGVSLNVAGTILNMVSGYIIGNVANNGGGISLNVNNTLVNMNGGVISDNTATNGGGVFLAAGALSQFHLNSGSIINNQANSSGGGIFATDFTYASPLPPGVHFPQLHVSMDAVFNGNVAGFGGFEPPINAGLPSTNIQAAYSRSGGFLHPLNNLDINFVHGDWHRLNVLIGPTGVNPTNIIIHPADNPHNVTAGILGANYNFIITDPGDGHTITTMSIATAPAATDPHRILVERAVTIEAAPDVDIVLALTATTPTNVGRHFHVGGASGNLTIGNPASTGTLSINAYADAFAGNRGGIEVISATAMLTLRQGGIITNNRAATGGGVLVSAGASPTANRFVMTGGYIYRNIATISGGGVALNTDFTRFTMDGGIIDGNVAGGSAITNGGGGVFVFGINSNFVFNAGTIRNNAAHNGGGVFASEHSYNNPLLAPSFPQLDIYPQANFYGNVAHSASTPPADALTFTNIAVTTTRSFEWHPLNNLDINFSMPGGIGDWMRLNTLIQAAVLPNPAIIVIYPTGSAVTPGYDVGTSTYTFVIEDLGDGSTIFTTSPIGTPGGVHSITINASQNVTIQAAPGADIVLNMVAATPASPGRHFIVTGVGSSHLTLGGGTGTLTLNGNRNVTTGSRGGITVSQNAELTLQTGTTIKNSHNNGSVGGGVSVGNSGANPAQVSILNMHDGVTITNNVASGSMGGGGGVGFPGNDWYPIINMYGGTISNNTAVWGGGIWAMSGTINMHSGYIIGNNGGMIGEGAPVVGTNINPHGGGGGVRICCRGVLNMHGGVIADNTARFGAGVLLSHGRPGDTIGAFFNMYGGEIKGNRASLNYVNPLNLHLGWEHNEDGGGVFITNNGLFTMRNPLAGTNELVISGNTAGQSGGGVYWNVGWWETPRTQPVEIAYNVARVDGGGIYLSYQTLEMPGEWRIDRNRANRGGGVFLHGNNAPHTYVPGTGWLPHPDRGYGTLIMHGGRIYDNWSYTSGGGVYIYRDAIFQMLGGSIDYNESAVFGGGVYVLNPGLHFTSRFEVTGGRITRNRAIYGGGVYLMFRAHLYADNVLFAGNEAQRMGGAIFTELVDYGYLLSGDEVPHDILHPTPPDPNEPFFAFTNIEILDTVRFGDTNCNLTNYGINTAIAAFHSPYNAIDMLPNVRWLNWNTAAHEHLSIHVHPFNNYDINYVRPIYFYKTDMEIYSYPRSINNLQGAVFALDIEVPDPNNPGQYMWQFYTQATSEANGRVALFVFTPGHFRLREVTPPTGLYILPPGHWYLDMELEEFEIDVPGASPILYELLYIIDPPPRTCSNNTEFFFVRLDRENAATPYCDDVVEARLRWHVGNAPPRVAMHLHKAGYEIIGMSPAPTNVNQLTGMLRPNAVFALYRYLGDGTPASTLVPAPGWVRTQGVHISTGDPNQPIELIRLGFREDQAYSYYQLVELLAPAGYMVPFGQWRVRMDVVSLPLNQVDMTVTPIGDSVPPFMRLSAHAGHVFAVGNRLNPDLPLTGGLGFGTMMPVIASGAAAVLVGLAALGYLVISKELKRKKALLPNTFDK